jgi:hypothetical protein
MERSREDILRFEQALLSLDIDEARTLLSGRSGQPLPSLEAEALIVPALEDIGRGWEEGRIALSQVYMSGRQCEELMETLQCESVDADQGGPRIAIAVLEDYHLLGQRLVYSVLRASGLALFRYGRMDLDALVKVSRCLSGEVRASDFCGRYGGEEFVLLMPETGLGIALQVADRIRLRIERQVVIHDNRSINVTVSLGAAIMDSGCADLGELLGRCDKALYEAKNRGRNRVCAWSPMPLNQATIGS